ncbi:hypothetical protein DFH29DRAFT_1030340 [Suillus ampliporus]|nr:hypothetical protein DFH29DRAFT_1030340 [Suillus ampliporus]
MDTLKKLALIQLIYHGKSDITFIQVHAPNFYATLQGISVLSPKHSTVPLVEKLTTTCVISDKKWQFFFENEVKFLILSMIESLEISSELSADGAVSFSHPQVKFEKVDVNRVLAQAQHQDALLMRLEKEMESNREYLTKAVKSKGDTASSWGPVVDEDGAFGNQPSGNWAEGMSLSKDLRKK